MLNIVLFGPPGAGKGTQSEKLIEKYQLIHLSTGDLLRSEIAAGTQLGLEAQMLMNAGVLVPDEVVIGMISSKLDKNPNAKGFIFDGFPRTEAQAEALDTLLSKKHTSITMMLALEVNESELTKRLLLRGMNSGRPDDQNESTIRNRIQEYNNKTAPLKNYYSAQGKFRSVEGIGSVDLIFSNLCAVIDPRSSKSVIDSPSPKEKNFISKAVKVIAAKQPLETKKVVSVKLVNSAAKTLIKKDAKKSIEKKDAPKKSNKNVVASNVLKKVVNKVAKKIVSSNKLIKNTAKQPLKKLAKKTVAKKTIKKLTPKKVLNKVAKKTATKKVEKKILKKVANKAASPKKSVKKVAKKKR